MEVPQNMKNLGFDTPEGLRNFANRTIGLDDTFQFHCTSCGKCCRNREDLLISPEDIHRICAYLGRQPFDFIQRYTRVRSGPGSHLPIVTVQPIAPDSRCPFLRGHKCSIHEVKPIACAAYPLGRTAMPPFYEPHYILQQNISCNPMDRTVKVRDWLGKHASAEREKSASVWFSFIQCYSMAIYDAWENFTDSMRNDILHQTFALLYLMLEPGESFLPQFIQRATETLVLLRTQYKIQFSELPDWVELHRIKSPELAAYFLERKAYGTYKCECCRTKGISYLDCPDTQAIQEGAFLPFDDFLFGLYQEPTWVDRALSADDAKLWHQFHPTGHAESNHI